MQVIDTYINGVKIIIPKVFEDYRGWFFETYSEKEFAVVDANIKFVQDNQSMSLKAGTLRGLHLQTEPMAQTKLIRCTRGELLDVAVDLRKTSQTYKKWVAVVLSENNKKQVFIPKGFAHGFITLLDNTEIQYKADNFYSKKHERTIKYNDPELAIEWGTDKPTLSEKDFSAPLLKDTDFSF